MVQERAHPAAMRRIALRFKLAQGNASFSELLRLPAYQSHRISERGRQRLLENDLADLRKAGFTVNAVSAGGEIRYELDDSRQIPIRSDTPLDLQMIRSLLIYKGKTSAEEYAQSAINKLLAQSIPFTAQENTAVIPTVPAGDYILQIARAIAGKKSLKFDYRPAGKPDTRTYRVQPIRVEVHFNAFYCLAYEISVNGRETGALRRYRAERIVNEPVLEPGTALLGKTAETENESAYFRIVHSRVLIRENTCVPLMQLAEKTEKNALRTAEGNFHRLTLIPMAVQDLLEYAGFYGPDLILEEPVSLRDDYLRRLRLMRQICAGDGADGKRGDAKTGEDGN